MSIELKLFIYWLIIVVILWIGAKIQHNLDNTSLLWKYWRENYGLGVWYMVVSRMGFWSWLVYGFLLVSSWWFKL